MKYQMIGRRPLTDVAEALTELKLKCVGHVARYKDQRYFQIEAI